MANNASSGSFVVGRRGTLQVRISADAFTKQKSSSGNRPVLNSKHPDIAHSIRWTLQESPLSIRKSVVGRHVASLRTPMSSKCVI